MPLNNLLERFNLANASADEMAKMRELFELPWNQLHLWRTVAAVLASASALMGVFLKTN